MLESFDTFAARVVELSRRGRAEDRESACAVDCSVAINPNIVAMQMESGIGYGLSAALAAAITLEEGVVKQSNFHDYPVVRMNQMPPIEVVIVPSPGKADRGWRAVYAGDRAGAGECDQRGRGCG